MESRDGMDVAGDGRSSLELRSERLELRLVPGFGCHWTSLRVSVKGSWLDVLKPVPDSAVLSRTPSGHGSYVLAPWSNRISGATFQFEGRAYALRENFKDHTAIHGDVRARPWKIIRTSPNRIEASLDSRDFGDFNFPFALTYRQVLHLFDDRLRAELFIQNVDRVRAPVGMGFHPFLRRRLTEKDRDLILVVPAARVYPARDCIPTGPAVPVGDGNDLRDLRPLGARHLDHCFTDLQSRSVRVIYPGTLLEARIRLDPVFSHVVVYAPVSAGGAPADFVAVEPVTHVNDGFNCLARGWQGTGVKSLEPGEEWGGGWELSIADV